jgi:hypothetical protein
MTIALALGTTVAAVVVLAGVALAAAVRSLPYPIPGDAGP